MPSFIFKDFLVSFLTVSHLCNKFYSETASSVLFLLCWRDLQKKKYEDKGHFSEVFFYKKRETACK